MFVGDGPPRRSIYRPWDGTLPSAPFRLTEFGLRNLGPQVIDDERHIQPQSFTSRYIEPHLSEGETRFYCFCTDSWLAFPHKCWTTSFELLPSMGRIPPRYFLSPQWVCRENKVKDRQYLEDMNMVVCTSSIGQPHTDPS